MTADGAGGVRGVIGHRPRTAGAIIEAHGPGLISGEVAGLVGFDGGLDW